MHPSYASNEAYHVLNSEYEELKKILARKPKASRQNYLMLRFPETYRNLIKLGIKKDYSLGYGTDTGFRAGIARPFYFYDMLKEEKTSLRLMTFQVMDRTLLSYLSY